MAKREPLCENKSECQTSAETCAVESTQKHECSYKFGYAISGLRVERNMTQQEFAELIGISRENLTRLENNYSTPRTETIIKICEVCGVTPNELFPSDLFSSEIKAGISISTTNSKHFNKERNIDLNQRLIKLMQEVQTLSEDGLMAFMNSAEYILLGIQSKEK